MHGFDADKHPCWEIRSTNSPEMVNSWLMSNAIFTLLTFESLFSVSTHFDDQLNHEEMWAPFTKVQPVGVVHYAASVVSSSL